MPRAIGDKNKGANEFARKYEQMCIEENVDPVRVLIKLCKSRVQSIKLQAAANLMKYRFPTQAAAKIEVEQAAQMVMSWAGIEEVPALEHLGDGSEPLDQREFVRHEIEETDIPL